MAAIAFWGLFCLRNFSTLHPSPSPSLSSSPGEGHTLQSNNIPLFFYFWKHSSCSVLLLNEAMFYWLWFTDLQILVATLSQSSHHQPLPAFPFCHTTLGSFSWANAVVPRSHADWGTDVVKINCINSNNNNNKILPILQDILFMVFNPPISSCCRVTQRVIWAQLGEDCAGAKWWEKSLGWE